MIIVQNVRRETYIVTTMNDDDDNDQNNNNYYYHYYYTNDTINGLAHWEAGKYPNASLPFCVKPVPLHTAKLRLFHVGPRRFSLPLENVIIITMISI